MNTLSGTNAFHGQIYGSFASNDGNADPFFFKQQYLLGQQGVGAFPEQLANPYLQRYTAGASIGGPVKKDKLFFYLAYQHMGLSDQSTGLSQFTVPTGLTNDRSTAGLEAAATSAGFTGVGNNIFRQAGQKRLDLSLHKTFHASDRFSVLYQFNVFNVFNTTSLDVPQDQVRIRQNDACSAAENTNPYNNCAADYLNYGQIATSNSAVDQHSALTNLDQLPVINGTGKGITVPLTLPAASNSVCTASTLPTGGCPNNGANFGSVTGTIGGSRAITMSLHIIY